MSNVYDVLMERGFVEQVSDEEGLRQALEDEITCYIGYDPTASSLHAGNLFTIMALAHLQRHGHRPIVVVGGGTGMIGDPSGRSEMRRIMTVEEIEANLQAIKKQMSQYLDFGDDQALILNNAEWLRPLNYIEFLRDIGQHFSVNRMLAAESYKIRLETGLSFIEFNYQLLQAYDFLHLYREYDCKLQMGGNDQWGNILAGVDLIRRVTGGEAYAMTFPLLTTASGVKMGKSAEGAVWLDADLLSPYEYYQYWINVADDDVAKFLKIYTFLPMAEIEQLAQLEGAAIREAKEVLAYEATRITHGQAEAEKARKAARELFAGEGATAAVPTSSVPQDEVAEGVEVVDLLCRAELTRSRSQARRLIQQGGAYVNDERVTSLDALVSPEDFGGEGLFVRAGKKRYHRFVIE